MGCDPPNLPGPQGSYSLLSRLGQLVMPTLNEMLRFLLREASCATVSLSPPSQSSTFATITKNAGFTVGRLPCATCFSRSLEYISEQTGGKSQPGGTYILMGREGTQQDSHSK